MQALDRLITEQWQDVYTLFSISRTVPFRLQNKGSDWITIQAVTTQPSPLSNEGVVLRTFDSLIITPEGGGCWVRVTNNTVVNAVVTYHPLEGILFQDVSSGSQTTPAQSSSSLAGVAPTMMGELATSDYKRTVNVKFTSGESHIGSRRNINGGNTLPSSISYNNNRAVLQSTSNGGAFLSSTELVKCLSGQQVVLNFSLSSSSTSLVSRWGIGDKTSSTDCIAFSIENGVFGIRWSNGVDSVFTPQSAFNTDKLDGTGKSLSTLDTNMYNEYRIVTGLCNTLPISFEWYSNIKNGYVVAHVIDSQHLRQNQSTSSDSLPLFVSIEGDSTLSLSSMSALVSGDITQEGKEFSVSVDNIDTVATVQSYIMTISNGQLLNGDTSNVVLEPSTFCSDGVRSFKWNIYKNIQLTNAVFNNVDTQDSSVSYDTVATSFTPLQQNIVNTVITSKNQSVDISYLTRNITLYPNDTLTITVTSNGNGTVGCVIRWKEPT